MYNIVPPTVQRRFVPIEILLRGRELSDLWINDRLERQSTHEEMQALITAMEDQFPKPITRSICPGDLLIGPVNSTRIERRFDAANRLCLYDLDSVEQTPIFPDGFQSASVFMQNHIVDRCAVGLSLLAFLIHCKCLIIVHTGIFHDIWNATRTTAKPYGAKFWKDIVKLSSIVNFNHGSFRIGQWRRYKEERLKQWCDTHTMDPLTSELPLSRPHD